MVQYKKTFLEEMKSLLSYFVEFSNDRSILPKIYLEYCAVGGPDQRLVIIITNDKNTFYANNGL